MSEPRILSAQSNSLLLVYRAFEFRIKRCLIHKKDCGMIGLKVVTDFRFDVLIQCRMARRWVAMLDSDRNDRVLQTVLR